MNKKLFLLDAMALIFRAYYALIRAPRVSSKGKNTNAQFGFTNTLVELMNNQKPSHMAVCFDTEAPTERHIDFTDYKANRQEAPEDLVIAIPDIKKIVRAFNIPIIELDGYEADDVIGTLSKQAAVAGYEVFMVTPDKDYGQLVSEKVKIYKPGYQGGTVEIIGPAEVLEKWNIKNISQVIDILGLMGDSVDNIPGIPGIGEKTAAKLLLEYDTIENILANAENIKGAVGEKVKAGKDLAVMSKKLATIITDVPVQFHEEDFKLKEWNRDALREIFIDLEFRAAAKRILGEELPGANGQTAVPEGVQQDLFGQAVNTVEKKEIPEENEPAPLQAEKNISNTVHHYICADTPEKRLSLITQLLGEKEVSFDTETTGIDANNAELVGLSFSWKPGEAYYIPIPSSRDAAIEILSEFDPLFENPDRLWIGQNVKYDLLVLKWYGIEVKGKIFDTMLAHYVIDPEGKRGMDLLSAQYLGYEPVHIEELIGKKGKGQGNMRDVAIDKITEYAAEDADITLQLRNTFQPLLDTKVVRKVFEEVENPLVKVLTDMEFEGIRVDMDFLQEYSKTLDKEGKQAEENVYREAGVRFNLSSPKQLGEVLFDKLKLDPKAKKTKTGQYATGEDVLLKLANQNKIVDDILAYRELTKLKSTYVDALPAIINRKTGRVHTSYAQAVAVTGRLSSNNPNLQNIPVRTERGREIRKAFIPRDENHLLVSADYSQIELRIVAAISGDPNMCLAFKEKKDIHTATAAKVFNVEEKEVTKGNALPGKKCKFWDHLRTRCIWPCGQSGYFENGSKRNH